MTNYVGIEVVEVEIGNYLYSAHVNIEVDVANDYFDYGDSAARHSTVSPIASLNNDYYIEVYAIQENGRFSVIPSLRVDSSTLENEVTEAILEKALKGCL